MKIAVSGKGGVGKTTIAAALIKSFTEVFQRVYAIDGDSDGCLGFALGIPSGELSAIKPVVEMGKQIRKLSGDGAFYALNPSLEDEDLKEFVYQHGKIDFMKMGDQKKGGSQCYCRENTFLQTLISTLLLDKDEAVIMDMGAGIEHLSRGTSRGVDLMLVVVEPSINSVNTANNVIRMAQDLGLSKVRIIGNKVRKENEKTFIEKSFQHQEMLGFIGFNENIWLSSMDPSQNDFSPDLLEGMKEIREKILGEAGGSYRKGWQG